MPFDASAFLAGLDAADRRVESACVAACNEFAEYVLAKSKEHCPVSPTDPKHPFYNGHSGALRDSGAAKEAVVEGDMITAEVGYNTKYAAAVHERLDLNHNYPGAVNPNAFAKFLEVPMKVAAPKFLEFVAGKVKEELGG